MRIEALGTGYRVVAVFDNVADVPCMAWGVRDDIIAGKTGLIANWCNGTINDQHVSWWNVTQ